MKASGMFALLAVVALCGFFIIGSMLMAGAVTDLNPEDVAPEYDTTADMMQTFFGLFQDWNVLLIWIAAVSAIIIGLWFLLRIKK